MPSRACKLVSDSLTTAIQPVDQGAGAVETEGAGDRWEQRTCSLPGVRLTILATNWPWLRTHSQAQVVRSADLMHRVVDLLAWSREPSVLDVIKGEAEVTLRCRPNTMLARRVTTCGSCSPWWARRRQR